MSKAATMIEERIRNPHYLLRNRIEVLRLLLLLLLLARRNDSSQPRLQIVVESYSTPYLLNAQK